VINFVARFGDCREIQIIKTGKKGKREKKAKTHPHTRKPSWPGNPNFTHKSLSEANTALTTPQTLRQGKPQRKDSVIIPYLLVSLLNQEKQVLCLSIFSNGLSLPAR